MGEFLVLLFTVFLLVAVCVIGAAAVVGHRIALEYRELVARRELAARSAAGPPAPAADAAPGDTPDRTPDSTLRTRPGAAYPPPQARLQGGVISRCAFCSRVRAQLRAFGL